MSLKYQVLDTKCKTIKSAKEYIANKISNKTQHTCINEGIDLEFDDTKTFQRQEDAISYILENSNDNLLVVKVIPQKMTKMQEKKITTIIRKHDKSIETTRARATKAQDDLKLCILNTLSKIRSAKKRQACNFCNSLVPTVHLHSHACPVCKEEGAFLTNQSAYGIKIRDDKYTLINSKLKKIISIRDEKIDAIKNDIVGTESTWITVLHHRSEIK